ncbi:MULTISPECIES: NUDIX hydrolase [unclassified Kitasatospora]|uniref:NUDIX hydrolase n=1 Tax=unclassified Kitasatospora TaxID=2633591 RepID=UPI0037FF19D0
MVSPPAGDQGAPGQDGRAGRELLAAAGVLFPDEQGRVLVVRLPYDREHPVAVPGGGWEPQDLSPRRTAVREIEEELGFTPGLGPLACVDWTLDHFRPPIAAYLYWADPLTPAQLAAITPDPAEVGGWVWLTPEQAGHALPPRLSRRVTACLRAPRSAGPLELEDSLPAGHTLDHLTVEPPPEYTRLAGLPLTGAAALAAVRPAAEPVPPLDRDTYIATRPRIRAKARTVFTDRSGRVLLVRLRPWPGTGGEVPYWVLPGGGIEADRELPRAAARREVREELGWDREPGRLLAVDWLPGHAAAPASGRDTAVLVYLFDGGTVAEDRLASIALAEDELAEWRLCAPAEARALLSDSSWARTEAALAARARTGGPAELVRGRPAD